jgi:N-acetylmuramoyl-L-alanine amidase
MDPASKVSYHFLLGRSGQLYSLVDPKHRAWHAGVAEWNGIKDVNAVSLGVSFANKHDGVEALTPIQIAVMLGAVEGWARVFPTLEAVTTHHAIAPTRKRDPLDSPGFDLAAYEEAFRRGVASR